jgi:hypothetical protein
MTSIQDRLTDAMNAAADTVREADLRPLVARKRRWHTAAWAAPAAAAAAVVLVIGLAVSASNGLFGTHQPAGPAHLPAPPHRFYLATDIDSWQTMVRSAVTGRAVAVVPVPSLEASGTVSPALAAAGNGTFYIAAFQRGVPGEQIFRFRLTPAGHVTGFARVPGGSLRPGWAADALAASPDGSLVALGAYDEREHRHRGLLYGAERSDQLIVIHTAAGTQSVWRGGSPAGGYKYFRVASLSWTGDSRELAVLGEWCRSAGNPGGELCPARQRQAQLRAIEPAGHSGGSVLDGRLLLQQSPHVPFLAQALMSPDGSTITAMVLHGQTIGNPDIRGTFPENLSVEQISVATGRRLTLLYQRRLGDTSEVSGPMADPLEMTADATAGNLILNGGICNRGCTNEFNGWLHAGRLVPLPPSGFAHRETAETW